MWLKISSESTITSRSAQMAAISSSWPTTMPFGRWGVLMIKSLVRGPIRPPSASRSKWKSGSISGA